MLFLPEFSPISYPSIFTEFLGHRKLPQNCGVFLASFNDISFFGKVMLRGIDGCFLTCVPVVVLKNYEPELSYILSELFNMYLKESCFPDCWKVSLVVLVFKNVGERCMAKIRPC